MRHARDEPARPGRGTAAPVSAPGILAVFSDLDGTLLDERYRHEAADATLARLRAAAVPLILTSSKTRAEMLRLRAELAPGMPVIFENGCGIATPRADAPGEERIERFGPDYASLRAIVEAVRAETGVDFRGFGDMSEAEVAERTGLAPEDAARARAREASEPGVLAGSDGDLEAFRTALAERSLRLVRGGRFLHVMPGADKADAVRRVGAQLRAERPEPGLVTIAAGDSENDADMLAAADHAVVVRRPDGSWLELGRAHGVLRSRAVGPAGWAECLDRLLDELLPTGHEAQEARP